MNFKEAATDIESLEQEFVKLRDDLSQAAVENTKTKCTAWRVQMDRRIRQRKRMPGELKRDSRTFIRRRYCARYEECI